MQPLWIATLSDIWTLRRRLPALWVLPAVILLVTGLLDMILWRRTLASDSVAGPGGTWIFALGLILAVGLIAVRWHRLALLSEPTGLVLGTAPLKSTLRYMLNWVIIGIVIGIVIIIALLVVVLSVYFAKDPTDLMYGGALDWMAFQPLWALVSAIFIYTFARAAMSLPHVAVTGRAVGMRASWRATAPAHRGLMLAALISAIAQMLVYGLPIWLPVWVFGDGIALPYPWAFDLGLVVFNVMVELLVITIGASLLTQAYRRVTPGLFEPS